MVKCPFPWIPYEQATHLIIGYNDEGGGILHTAQNQMEAYRVRAWYRSHGYPQAKVGANEPAEHQKVEDACIDFLLTGAVSR